MMIRRLLFGLTLLALPASASEEGAQLELERYERAIALYEEAFAVAKTPAEKLAAAELRPNANGYAQRLINQMARQGDAEWVVPYIGWIFMNAPGIEKKQIKALRDFFESTHLRSPGAGSVAYGLTSYPDPRSLELARAVMEKNPDPKEKGVAALAVSSLIKNLGETPQIFSERRDLLRRAITHSIDMKIGERTVGEIVKEDLFVMMNLTKGRLAPKVSGQDVAGKMISTEMEKGRAIVLVFWSGEAIAQGKRTADFMKKLQDDMAAHPFTLIGVTTDAKEEVRKLVADGVITWKNIWDEDGAIHKLYRVAGLPTSYVIDKEGLIQYKGVPGPFVELTALDLAKREKIQ